MASKYDGAEISVAKWQEYQNRSDGKTHKWFKLDNDIAIGPALHGMNCEHKWLFVFILSMTAKKLGRSFTWNSEYVESVTGVKPRTQEQALEILINRGTIKTNLNLVELTSTNFQEGCLEEKRREEKRVEENREEKSAKKVSSLVEEKTNLAVAAYCRGWKKRYGTNPAIRGKDAGILKRLAGDFGTEKVCGLIEAYLSMTSDWFLKRRHDLPTFESNLNAVVQFHDTGQQVTNVQARQADKAAAANDQMRRIAEGTL